MLNEFKYGVNIFFFRFFIYIILLGKENLCRMFFKVEKIVKFGFVLLGWIKIL